MNLLNLEDEMYKTVTVKGYEFKIKVMTAKELRRIAQIRISLQDGNSVDCLSNGDFIFFESIAICDVCVEESPEDFDENLSSEEWIDVGLIDEVATEIRKFTKAFEKKLKKNKPIAGKSEK